VPLYSLRNQKKFDLVNLHGKKVSSPYFMVVIAQNFSLIQTDSQNPTFLGMKVSKKISKKAYIRNKIKRRIRHLTRLMLKEYDLNLSKVAIIFIPYKNFDLVEFAKLSFEFKSILQKTIKKKITPI
jgi:ribonuclease P protein component